MTIQEIENWYKNLKIPESDIKVMDGFVIPAKNIKQTIEGYIHTLKKHPKNKGYMPYYHDLLLIIKTIENERS